MKKQNNNKFKDLTLSLNDISHLVHNTEVEENIVIMSEWNAEFLKPKKNNKMKLSPIFIWSIVVTAGIFAVAVATGQIGVLWWLLLPSIMYLNNDEKI